MDYDSSEESTVRIQYASDLHLEFEPERIEFEDILLNVHGKENVYLVLAGDIGTLTELPVLRRFLEYCSQNWHKVFYIPGNHEYYHYDFDEANAYLKSLCNECNVIFALFDSYRISRKFSRDIVIIMTTLWSYIPEHNARVVESKLNDYKLISKNKRKITSRTVNEIHQDQRSRLQCAVSSLRKEAHGNIETIVFTHHSPYPKGTSDPTYENNNPADINNTNCAFSSDCSDIMQEGVSQWIYGHTHYNPSFHNINTLKISGTIIRSNQRGYVESECDGYSSTDAIITLK